MGIHDRLFKTLLRAFFEDFLELALPHLSGRLKGEAAEFLDKEVLTDLPGRSRRELDLVAKVPARGSSPNIVLIHVEIERTFRASTARRLWRYYLHLLLRHQLPVVPVVLFLRGGPPGPEARVHREEVLGTVVAELHYTAMGLSRAQAESWLERPQPLAAGLAALMKPSALSPAEHKLACLSRIATAKLDEARRFLLVNTVETYLQLKETDQSAFRKLLGRPTHREVHAMEMTWADKIAAEAETKGLLSGGRRIVLSLLERRFGPLPAATVGRLEAIDDPQVLERIGHDLLDAESLEALDLN